MAANSQPACMPGRVGRASAGGAERLAARLRRRGSRMRRRQFVARLCGAAASSLWPLAGSAQQADRVRRIAVLMAMAPADAEARRRAQALEEGLRALGWVEGRNIRIDYRWAPGDNAELQEKAATTV